MGTINDVFILIQLGAVIVIFDLLKSDDLSDAVNSFTTRNQQQFFSGLKKTTIFVTYCASPHYLLLTSKKVKILLTMPEDQ